MSAWRRPLYLASCASLLALIALALAWELWLAPIRPGGSWLALKALPLALAAPGVVRARVYTYQWAPMLVLFYFAEGVVRAWSESGPSATLAAAQTALSLAFFLAAVLFVRAAAGRRG